MKQEFAEIRDSGAYSLEELIERAEKGNIDPGEQHYIIKSFIAVYNKPYSPTQWWDVAYRSCIKDATEIVVDRPS